MPLAGHKITWPTISSVRAAHRWKVAGWMALDVARELGISERAGVLERLQARFVARMDQGIEDWPRTLKEAKDRPFAAARDDGTGDGF
jgi:hypothetical protein